MTSRVLLALCPAALCAFIATPTHAGVIPAVEVSIQATDGTDTTFNPDGANVGGGVFSYVGDAEFAGFTIGWDFDADPTLGGLSDGAKIGSNFDITNTSDETITFAISLTLPLDAGGTGLQYFGSSGFTLSGVDGMLATPGPGMSLWEAYADGSEVDSLFDHPSVLQFTGAGTTSTSNDLDSGFTDALDTIGIVLNFSLSPMDTVTTTGIFAVVPAPPALAILGLGLFGRRRRRN